MLAVLFFVGTILFIYLYLTKHTNYWKDRNVPFLKPKPIVGNFYNVLTLKKGIGFFLADLYNEMIDHPFFGIWVFNKPCLIIKSPDLLKSVLVSDFDAFPNRTIYCNDNVDPYGSNILFVQRNSTWTRARKLISPAFTSGKLKAMMPLMEHSASDMVHFVQNKIKITDRIEAKDIFQRYMVSIIATCVFGIEVKTFEDAESKFNTVAAEMFKGDLSNAVRASSHIFLHSIVDYFKLHLVKPVIMTFLSEVFTETITHREKENIRRNDFVEALIHYKQEEEKNGYGNADIKAIAQAAQFYLAGFETTSSTMSFTLYEMSINPNYQRKLRDDILSNIQKHGGLTYEAMMDMKYLDNCLSETLRKYPVLPFLDRLCAKDYKLPGTDIVIEKGTPVYIPLFGLHYDPKYYPNPEKYDPDRFADTNSQERNNFYYLPFGGGPRICIGARFGLLSAKLGLINIISNFEVTTHKDTPVPIIFDPKSMVLQSVVGLPMKFNEYNDLSKK